jgi:hypothetical protein
MAREWQRRTPCKHWGNDAGKNEQADKTFTVHGILLFLYHIITPWNAQEKTNYP